jgi:hypothetical protein
MGVNRWSSYDHCHGFTATSIYKVQHNLKITTGFFVLGALSKSTGANIYEFETQDGRSVFKALDYLISTALQSGISWPVPNSVFFILTNIKGDFDTGTTVQMAKDAFVELKDIKYRSQAYEMQGSEFKTWNMNRLWTPFGAYDGRERSAGRRIGVGFMVAGVVLVLGL